MILDGVIGSSRQQLGDLCPLVTKSRVCIQQDILLGFSPGFLFDARIEMVVPAFTTLFSDSPWEMAGDRSPVFRSIFAHQLDNDFVFFLCPGAFHEMRIENFLPAMETLHASASRQMRRNFLPVFPSVQFHRLP